MIARFFSWLGDFAVFSTILCGPWRDCGKCCRYPFLHYFLFGFFPWTERFSAEFIDLNAFLFCSTRWLGHFHSPFSIRLCSVTKRLLCLHRAKSTTSIVVCSSSKLCSLEWSFTRDRESWHERNRNSFRWNRIDGVEWAESFVSESLGAAKTSQSFWRKLNWAEESTSPTHRERLVVCSFHLAVYRLSLAVNGDVFHLHDIFHQPCLIGHHSQ